MLSTVAGTAGAAAGKATASICKAEKSGAVCCPGVLDTKAAEPESIDVVESMAPAQLALRAALVSPAENLPASPMGVRTSAGWWSPASDLADGSGDGRADGHARGGTTTNARAASSPALSGGAESLTEIGFAPGAGSFSSIDSVFGVFRGGRGCGHTVAEPR